MKWYIWNESYMNWEYEIKWSYDLRSWERNFCNCVEKPEKFWTSTGFEPVTSRFRCDALTNWAMKPLTLGAGHLWVLMVPWGMNQWWNDKMSVAPESRGHGFKSRWSPEFFRLLYAIAKIALITAKIIASLDFISTVHIRFISYIPFHHWFIPHGTIRTHKWPAPNVSGFK